MNSFHERGSSLFIILIAVALFAALSYALSRGGDSAGALSQEKLRLLASDVIDYGEGLADATAKLRLRRIMDTEISFENSIVAGYTNAACSTGTCKVFDFDGGGKDWETPASDVNGAVDIGITGGLAIKDLGSNAADLVMVMPGLSSSLCARINVLLGLHDASSSPSVIAAVSGNKFTGTYAAVPVTVTSSQIDKQKSGCFQATAAAGSAFTGTPLANSYIFYQVLLAR